MSSKAGEACMPVIACTQPTFVSAFVACLRQSADMSAAVGLRQSGSDSRHVG